VDSTSTVVSTGTYGSSGSIAFNGVEVQLQGQPATGDSFVVEPSATEDMFTMVNDMLATLTRPSASPSENALYHSEMGATIAQLDNALERISDVRSEVGARLSVLSSAEDNQADRQLDLTVSLSEIRDLDYAEAITTLNLQLTGLQAAQMSYAKISGLNLFNYL
jgi:flagellar hook-associated protein 3 FlgL